MTHRLRSLLYAATAVVALTTDAGAQGTDSTIASVKAALAQVRTGVERRDWPMMSALLPPGSKWYEQIEQLVKEEGTTGGGFSFWASQSRVPLDELTFTVGRDGSVTVRGPIYIGTSRGEWTARLRRINGKWQFAEAEEVWSD